MSGPGRKPSKIPQVTNRRQFKAWLIVSLMERGIALPAEPTYTDIQRGVQRSWGAQAVNRG